MESQGVMSMTAAEAKRLYVIQQVMERKLRQRPAAELVHRSVRQIRRLVQRVRQEGPPGIAHRLRGRPSNRRHPAAMKPQVLRLYQARYRDFGPTLFAEQLRDRHRLAINRETLRQWLQAAGLWSGRRRPPRHRTWRERKACVGELVQLDGSHHAWLEGRGPALVLMAYIDDASNRVFARFYDYEGTQPALDSFGRYVRRYGLPQALYVDRHTTYRSPAKPTVEEELANRPPQSQFERALAALGVDVQWAYSPQAKGRVERLFGILQDRLIKELRLAGVRTRQHANRFLTGYLSRFNRQFQRAPRGPTDLHRPAPPPAVLTRHLAIRHTRVLRRDNTIQHAGQGYLIESPWPGRRPPTVQCEARLNGKLYLVDGDRPLRYRPIAERPRTTAGPRLRWRRRPPRGPLAPDHPWRAFRLPGSAPPRVRLYPRALDLNTHKEDTSILHKSGHF